MEDSSHMEFPIEIQPSHKWWPFVREDGTRFVEAPTASATVSAEEIQGLVGADCWRAVLNTAERKVTVLFDEFENRSNGITAAPPIREAMRTDLHAIVPDGALLALTMFYEGGYRVLATRQGDRYVCRVFATAHYLEERNRTTE